MAIKLHPITGLAVAFLLLFSGVIYARLTPPTIQDVPSPDSWVGFDADETTTMPGHPETVYGRFNQGADGSTRHETGPRLGEPRIIDIKNITLSRLFVFANVGEGSKWYSYPMILPPNGVKPQKMRQADAKPVTLPLPNNPFQLLTVTSNRGDVQFVAPALNFFPILEQQASGHRRERTNVVVRAQDPSLFEPPTGAAVVECPQPAGIVSRPRDYQEAPKKYEPCGPEGRPRPQQHNQ
jgi:hypothetical protein